MSCLLAIKDSLSRRLRSSVYISKTRTCLSKILLAFLMFIQGVVLLLSLNRSMF